LAPTHHVISYMHHARNEALHDHYTL